MITYLVRLIGNTWLLITLLMIAIYEYCFSFLGKITLYGNLLCSLLSTELICNKILVRFTPLLLEMSGFG